MNARSKRGREQSHPYSECVSPRTPRRRRRGWGRRWRAGRSWRGFEDRLGGGEGEFSRSRSQHWSCYWHWHRHWHKRRRSCGVCVHDSHVDVRGGRHFRRRSRTPPSLFHVKSCVCLSLGVLSSLPVANQAPPYLVMFLFTPPSSAWSFRACRRAARQWLEVLGVGVGMGVDLAGERER